MSLKSYQTGAVIFYEVEQFLETALKKLLRDEMIGQSEVAVNAP